MKRSARWTALAAALGLLLALVHLAAAPPLAARAAVSTAPGTGFRSHQRLVEHFRKHGREFGVRTADEYLRLARALRDRPAGGPVLEAVRSDGVIVRYDRATGAFLAFDRDGTIRTLFKPRRGESYYRQQLERGTR